MRPHCIGSPLGDFRPKYFFPGFRSARFFRGRENPKIFTPSLYPPLSDEKPSFPNFRAIWLVVPFYLFQPRPSEIPREISLSPSLYSRTVAFSSQKMGAPPPLQASSLFFENSSLRLRTSPSSEARAVAPPPDIFPKPSPALPVRRTRPPQHHSPSTPKFFP